jgi:NAD(P)H-dependent FMN reductase
MKLLALSGSLRAGSINSALLRTAARLAPPDMPVLVYTGLGDLPLFNPDLEAHCPASVLAFQAAVAAADALLIASPEYAHGVTGTIKNALDWLVSFEPFAFKPVAVLNSSGRSYVADAALRETLKTMAANIIEPASVTIPLLGIHRDETGMLADAGVVRALCTALAALRAALAGAG